MPMPSATAPWIALRLELVNAMRQLRPIASMAWIMSSRHSPRGGKVTSGTGSRWKDGCFALSIHTMFSGRQATASRLLQRCLTSTRSSSPRS
ncbi:hypothetical protein D9M71_795470 [compost metagenome]